MDEIDKKEWYETVGLEDAKNIIKSNLITAARSFIAIGYYLKHIRDHRLFIEDGYETVWEFAKEEFGISMSTASRYMSMNDRFSRNGNSPLIQEQYKDFGKSQLQEMLSLTDEQIEAVTPDITVQKLREMRTPKEIPYFEIEGQMDLEEDFPETVPGKTEEPQFLTKQTFTMDVSDLLEETPEENTVAISQQNEPGQEMEHELRRKYCNAMARKLIEAKHEWFAADHMNRVLMVVESEKQLKQLLAGKEAWYFTDPCGNGIAHVNLFRDYIQFFNGNSWVGDCEWFYLCAAIQSIWNVIAMENIQADLHEIKNEGEKLPDEKWNLGDLPQAKDRYVAKLARAVVNEYGSRMIFRFGGLSGKEAVNMLTSKCGGDIDIGDDVKAYAVAEVIEFYSGDTDLGVCSYAKFVTQVQKALEDWKTENEKKNQEPEQETVIDTEFTEIIPEPATYDKDIIKEMIHQEEQMLAELGESWKKNRSHYYTKHTMMLDAYRMLQAAHEGGN